MTRQLAPPPGGKSKSTLELIADPGFQSRLRSVMPVPAGLNRFCQVAINQIKRTPDLMEADPYSLLSAVTWCAAAGVSLEPVNPHVYLVPFNRQVTPILSASGMIHLARMVGAVKRVEYDIVHENDQFQYRRGTDPFLDHVPALSNRGKRIAIWVILHLPDGETQFSVYGEERLREWQTAGGSKKPWREHLEAMLVKTAIKRAMKYVPMSTAQPILSDDEDYQYYSDQGREAEAAPPTPEPIDGVLLDGGDQ